MNLNRQVAVLCLALFCLMPSCENVAIAAEVAAPAIPYKRDRGSDDIDLSRVALSLLICVLLAGGVVYVLRRRFNVRVGDSSKARLLRLVETQRLNPKAALYVVEFAGSSYLLAYSEHGINCVAHTAIDGHGVLGRPNDSQ